MAERAPILPKMSPPERRILHAVGFVAACRIHDDRMDLIVDGLRRDLAALDKALHPHTGDLIIVAQSICAAFKRRSMAGGAVDWMSAHIDASRISQRFHWAALCSLDGM